MALNEEITHKLFLTLLFVNNFQHQVKSFFDISLLNRTKYFVNTFRPFVSVPSKGSAYTRVCTVTDFEYF
jgi:hypothetical protein